MPDATTHAEARAACEALWAAIRQHRPSLHVSQARLAAADAEHLMRCHAYHGAAVRAEAALIHLGASHG